MKKTLALLLVVMLVLSVVTMPASSAKATTNDDVITAEDQINRIVTHNFEEYDVDSAPNWIGKDEGGNGVDNSPPGWVINKPRSSDTDTIQVVKDPLNSGRGNVLKHSTTSTTATIGI